MSTADDVIYTDDAYEAVYQNSPHNENFRTAAKAFMNAPGTETEAKLREAAREVVDLTCGAPAHLLEQVVGLRLADWLVEQIKKEVQEPART
jgi:hypothetical protein